MVVIPNMSSTGRYTVDQPTSELAYSGHTHDYGKIDLSSSANKINNESNILKKIGMMFSDPAAAKEVIDYKFNPKPLVEAVSNGLSQMSPTSASYGVAGSPATADEIIAERKPLSIDGAPITSAVSGIQDQENRLNAWTEMMANSAHQREIQDLIKAGLNPVLSARYGGSDTGSVFAGEATSAAAAGSGGGRSSRSGFLGLSPVSNPRTPLQMAYNLVVANGDKFVHAAKQIASAASKME